MKRLRPQFLRSLTPGVRILLGVTVAAYLAALICELTHAFDLNGWLSLNGRQFWEGQIWRIATYPLVPVGVMPFIMDGVALVILGGAVERIRTRGELWKTCAVSAVGAGLVKVVLQSSSSISLTGMAPTVFGLLASWCFLCAHEKLFIFPLSGTVVWQLAFLAGAVGFFITAFSAGWSQAVILLAGGLSGWFYNWFTHKWMMNRDGRVVHSERINRLEL